MKKFLIVLLLLAVAGGAFAQDFTFTVQGKVDAEWLPFQYADYDGDGYMGAGLGRDTGDGTPMRAGLFVAAGTDNLGLKIQLRFNSNGSWGLDDNLMVWWKPVPAFELDVGKFVNDPLRGKIGDNWLKGFTLSSYGNDDIFFRFRSQGANIGSTGDTGVLALVNYEGFIAGVLFPSLKPWDRVGMDEYASVGGLNAEKERTYVIHTNGEDDFGHVYERAQIGVGYNIPDIGLARIQFVGANSRVVDGFDIDDTLDPIWEITLGRFQIFTPRLEVAFALTAVDNLTLDIGAKIPFALQGKNIKTWDPSDRKWTKDANKDREDKYQLPYQVGVGAQYVIDDLTLVGRIDAKFGGSYDPGIDGVEPLKFAPEVNFHIWPKYNLGFMSVGLDFGLGWYGKYTQDGDTVYASSVIDVSGTLDPVYTQEIKGGIRAGGGIWVEKAWATGSGTSTIRGGLAYRAGTEVNGIKEPGVFSIPVVFDYTF